MELTQVRYQLGQSLRHPQFGDGLIVDVHTDRGREVLEVVFGGQLRRLSAVRAWEIIDTDGDLAPALEPAASESETDGDGAAPARDDAVATPRRAWHVQGDALITRWRRLEIAQAPLFDLRLQAEGWAGWAEPERLVSLDSLRGVERFHTRCVRVSR